MGVVVGAAFIAGVVGRVMYKKNSDKLPLDTDEHGKLEPLCTGWRKEYAGFFPTDSSPQQTRKAIVQSLQRIGVIRDLKESSDAIKASVQVSPLKLHITYYFNTENDQSVHYTVSSRNVFCTAKRIHSINSQMLSAYRTLSGTG